MGIDKFDLSNLNTPLDYAIVILAGLIFVVAAISLVISVVLVVKYYRFNKTMNTAGMTGEQAARLILDKNDLKHIKVSVVGSLAFGNSYSHYFKKVRLRRFTRGKPSLTSLAMGAQKSALAVLDKEGDPDMKKRIKIVPFMTFGPFAFIPLMIVGVLIDILIMKSQNAYFTIAFSAIGLLFYLFAFILSVITLKTEKKAQVRAYDLLRENHLATEEEIEDIKALFKLYNIQYINDTILAFLELLYYVLTFIASFTNSGSSFSSKS